MPDSHRGMGFCLGRAWTLTLPELSVPPMLMALSLAPPGGPFQSRGFPPEPSTQGLRSGSPQPVVYKAEVSRGARKAAACGCWKSLETDANPETPEQATVSRGLRAWGNTPCKDHRHIVPGMREG